jgi:arylsulfatase
VFQISSGVKANRDVMMEVDWSVGEIMKALELNGLDKNTIVIFTSDNGLKFGNHGTTGA